MQQEKFFAYSWHVDKKETDYTIIRIYGLNERNENVCVVVNNFKPYIYIELPENIDWDEGNAMLVVKKLDSLLGRIKAYDIKPVFKKRLYYANILNGKHRIYPYLRCEFNHPSDIRQLTYRLNKPFLIQGIGRVKLNIYENNAKPVLQLTSQQKLPTTGWIIFKGKKVDPTEQVTHCKHEYTVKFNHMKAYESSKVARPLILSYDIECYSSIPNKMPDAGKPEDKVFQISCVFARQNSETHESYLLTLGQPDFNTLGSDIGVLTYDTEHDMLMGFVDIIREKQPNIIIGYNIFGFDIPYMLQRAQDLGAQSEFDKQGMDKYGHAERKEINWSSSAFKNQNFTVLDAEGRIFFDLLPYVRRGYKFSNYKLKTIASHFLDGITKDPLDVKGIFKCYRLGMKGGKKGRRALSLVGKYCVKDSVLVLKLFEVLTTWIALSEMSKVTNVQIFSLYTQGEQLKVFSQVYRDCTHDNVVVEKDKYILGPNDHYVGATVFPPVPGVYDKVIPLDFSSLYPTTIIAYNISWDTFVPEDSNIPDEECHIMSWHDHVSCMHDPKEIRKKELNNIIKAGDVELKELRRQRDLKGNKDRKEEYKIFIAEKTEEMRPLREERSQLQKTKNKHTICCKRHFRWLKKPQGIMPKILSNLLNARAKDKKALKQAKEELKVLKVNFEDEKDQTKQEKLKVQISKKKTQIEVLDKRQQALKLSANSGYGAFGVRKGYLPLMPAAMCTTYRGRMAVQQAAEVVQKPKYGGKLIYGDTDCVRKDTPVLVRYNNIIDYVTVDTVSNGNWEKISEIKDISDAKKGYEIWSDFGFTKIVKVVRCKAVKLVSRIVTHTGIVECSNEHSLLLDDCSSTTPTDLNINDKLRITNLPLPSDTPDKPEHINGISWETIELYKIPDMVYAGIHAEIAFVWGLFYADGSCGEYKCQKYVKKSWAINNQCDALLNRCRNILNKRCGKIAFKILETMKSSQVKKLVPFMKIRQHDGTIGKFVTKYRDLFYDNRKYKKIPSIILNSPLEIRTAFFMGYYAGDGSKKESCIRVCNKGTIGSAGIFFLMKSLGYKVSVNTRQDKPDIYRLTASCNSLKYRYDPSAVKKIIPVKHDRNEYIYDMQTENHHFAAGIGQIVVHNSNYVSFPHLNTAQECWDHAIKVSKKISKLYPKPMNLAFEEKIYWRFFIITKKRYMSLACKQDGILEKDSKGNLNINKKGVLLQRRDNCNFIRKVYAGIIMMIFEAVSCDNVLYQVIQDLNNLCAHYYNFSDFIITKSVGDVGNLKPYNAVDDKNKQCFKVGDYKVKKLSNDEKERKHQFKLKKCDTITEYYVRCLPAQVQLAVRMRRRGQLVAAGSRLEYVITTMGGHTAKQYEKVESSEYFAKHSSSLNLDYMYYMKQLANPLDQILNIMYNNDKGKYKYPRNFVLEQYKYRLRIRDKMLTELKGLFTPKLRFTDKQQKRVKCK